MNIKFINRTTGKEMTMTKKSFVPCIGDTVQLPEQLAAEVAEVKVKYFDDREYNYSTAPDITVLLV